MMENGTGNNKLDEDILQCKADILRLRSLTPPSEPKKEKLPDKNTTRSKEKVIAATVSSTAQLAPNTSPPEISNQINDSAEKTTTINDESDLAEIPFSKSMGEDTIMISDDSRFIRIPTFEEIMTRQSPFSEDNGKKTDLPVPAVISEKIDNQQEPSTINDDSVEKPVERQPTVESVKVASEKPAEISIIKSAQQLPQEPVVEKMENSPAAPTEKTPEKSPQKSSVELVVDSIIDLPEKTDIDKPVNNEQEKENIIPEFNLAEQILSEQRKVSGARRVAPGKKNEPAAPLPSVVNQPVVQKEEKLPAYAGQKVNFTEKYRLPDEILFADIVTRDIEKFYSLCKY